MSNDTILFENENYIVTIVGDVLQPDGVTRDEGYAITNRVTGVTEMTTSVLPDALWKADQFSGMIVAFDNRDEDVIVGEELDGADGSGEDVTIN